MDKYEVLISRKALKGIEKFPEKEKGRLKIEVYYVGSRESAPYQ